jgi:hypothetical protein
MKSSGNHKKLLFDVPKVSGPNQSDPKKNPAVLSSNFPNFENWANGPPISRRFSDNLRAVRYEKKRK